MGNPNYMLPRRSNPNVRPTADQDPLNAAERAIAAANNASLAAAQANGTSLNHLLNTIAELRTENALLRAQAGAEEKPKTEPTEETPPAEPLQGSVT